MDRRMKYVFAGLMVALLIAMCIPPIMPALAESTYSLLRYVKDRCDEIIARIGLATDAITADTLFGRLNWIKDQFTTYWTTTRAGYLDILNTDAKYLVTNALPGTEVPNSIGKLVKELRTAITDTRAANLDKVPQITVASGSLASLTATGDLLPAVNIGKTGKVRVTVTILASGTSTATGEAELQISWDGTSYYTLEKVTIPSGTDARVTHTFSPFAAQYFKVALTSYPTGASSVTGNYAYVYETAP